MTATNELFRQAEAHVRAGRLEDARKAYDAILARDPADIRAAYRRAVVLLMARDYKAGEKALLACREAMPDDPDILFSLGRARFAQDDHTGAIEALATGRRAAPERADIHAALGDAYYLSGDLGAALAAYRDASARNPDDPRTRINAANVLSRLGAHDEACAIMDAVVARAPDRPEITLLHANILRAAGHLDAAGEAAERILARAPDNLGARACKAEVLDRKGRNEEAARLLEALVARDAVPPALARALGQVTINGAPPLLPPDRVVAAIDRCLATDEPNSYDRRGLQFMRAQLLQKLGDHAAAFESCMRANAEARAAYDRDETDARFAAYRRTFDPARRDRLPRATMPSARPLFIVGMPRSGTTLVEQILDSHPDIAGAGELNDIPRSARSIDGYPAALAEQPVESLDATAAEYLAQLDRVSTTARYVVDKMPVNFEHLGYIWQLFPGAPIIHCRRHPLGTGLSCLFQNFRHGNGFAFSLEGFAHYYRHYAALMEFWTETLDLPVIEVRYEDLVTDPPARIAELLEFCDLAWDDACLAFDRNRRFIDTLSYAQVRRPIDTAPTARHERYARELAPLADALAKENADYEAGA